MGDLAVPADGGHGRALLIQLLAIADPAAAPGWADAMLKEFGSIGAAIGGDPARLARWLAGDRRCAALLAAHRQLSLHVLREQVRGRPIVHNGAALRDYLHLAHAHERVEVVRVLFLDRAMRLIQDEEVSRGTIDEARVYIAEVIKRALDVGAAGFIIVHNHPSGSAQPSSADVELTRRLRLAGEALGVALHDHVLVAGDVQVSLKARGLI